MSTEEDSGKSRKTFPPSSGEIHIPQMLTNNQEMLKDRPTSSVAEPEPIFWSVQAESQIFRKAKK